MLGELVVLKKRSQETLTPIHPHTHTHTHIQRQIGRERGRETYYLCCAVLSCSCAGVWIAQLRSGSVACSAMERTLFLNQVCSATRFVKLSSPLVAAEDEEDGRRIVRMDEQALRVAMGSQSMSPRKTYSSLSMDKSPTAGSASSQSQFDPKVYGRVDYQIVVTGPDADKVSRGKRGEQAPAAELKLWVNVKCSDSESIFISVDGSDFVSWHVNYSDEYAWRKFWKNIPLSAGKHVITLGFKYVCTLHTMPFILLRVEDGAIRLGSI